LPASRPPYFSLTTTFKDTAETESEVAEKSNWDQANRGEKLGLVWRNRKKISQIINDYLYLPFFLLVIFCSALFTHAYTHQTFSIHVSVHSRAEGTPTTDHDLHVMLKKGELVSQKSLKLQVDCFPSIKKYF
jgi:hypothetical protein